MAFSVPPSVQYSERDATLFTKADVTVRAGFSGIAPWGEANKPVSITSGEQDLVAKFFKPTDHTYQDFLVAVDYMKYSNSIYFNRLLGPNAKNSVDKGKTAVLIDNRNAFDTATFEDTLKFVGKYAGVLGNSIAIEVADKDTFASWHYKDNFEYEPKDGEYAVCVVDTTGSITGGNVARGQQFAFKVDGAFVPKVDGVPLDTMTSTSTPTQVAAYLASKYDVGVGKKYASATNTGATVRLTYNEKGVKPAPTPVVAGSTTLVVAGSIGTAGTASVAQVDVLTVSGSLEASKNITIDGVSVTMNLGDSVSVIHNAMATALADSTNYSTAVVSSGEVIATRADYNTVVDIGSVVVSGISDVVDITKSQKSARFLGTVIPNEVYELLRNEPTAKYTNGASSYFVDVLNNTSSWIYTTIDQLTAGRTELEGGVDDYNVDRVSGFDAYKNTVTYDVNAVVDSSGVVTAQQAAIDVCIKRRDAVAFISPPMSSVVNQRGRETDLIREWSMEDVNRDSSYFFQDDNWGYVWDKYNAKWRWIPCAGGTAGLRARTHSLFGPWKSFAFHNRGKYSGYARTAWSADDDQRLILFKAKVNSISTVPGGGIVLMGDKTGLSRPSAFDRCNVRDTFIMMEKNISGMAKYFLGENNDEFTRGLFLNTVRPYIRNLEDQRAILEGKVKCDETNNTGQVIASNTMKAGIWIKPQYSINWIFLDFAALRPDMSFEELEGGAGIATAG
ncbi:tail sheath [Vibrio phage K469]